MQKLHQKLLILGGSCFIAVILAEIIIRTFPFTFARYLKLSEITLQRDKDIGFIYTPFQRTFFCSECFYNPLFITNSLGFRGPEWDLKNEYTVAILGDSVIAGREVKEDSHTCFILGKLLKKKIINAAIGGKGTVSELITYRKFLRPLHPKITILFFCKSTDIIESSCQLNHAVYGFNCQPCSYIFEGRVRVVSYSCSASQKINNLRTKIRDSLYRYLWSVKVIYRFVIEKIYKIINYKTLKYQQVMLYVKVDTPEQERDKIWQEGWEIIENALVTLKKEVESDGGRFLVVFLTEYQECAGKKMKHASSSLQNICIRNGISFLDTFDEFQDYKEKWQLQDPYFSYWCDGHYNPLGHFLLAHVVARYLIREGWLPLNLEETNILLKKIERNLNLAPKEVLGEEGYRQIYGHRVFLGSNNISKILDDN